jgi:hypothetical protein
MIYAAMRDEIETPRKAFIHRWRLTANGDLLTARTPGFGGVAVIQDGTRLFSLAERMQAVARLDADVFGALQPRIFAAWRIQKRKRNPTVGSMLLRWRKPKANPLFTCENMTPK